MGVERGLVCALEHESGVHRIGVLCQVLRIDAVRPGIAEVRVLGTDRVRVTRTGPRVAWAEMVSSPPREGGDLDVFADVLQRIPPSLRVEGLTPGDLADLYLSRSAVPLLVQQALLEELDGELRLRLAARVVSRTAATDPLDC